MRARKPLHMRAAAGALYTPAHARLDATNGDWIQNQGHKKQKQRRTCGVREEEEAMFARA